MLHAKTAVADLHWSRIGSTNLNLASLMGNYELDVAIEDAAFAARMAEQFELDLTRATEIVLTSRNRVKRSVPRPHSARRSPSGSAGRAAAGAVSMGSALGAALTNRRALGRSEAGLLSKMAIAAVALSAVGAIWPQVLAWPLAVIAAWIGVSWMSKAWTLRRRETPRELGRAEDEERAEGSEPMPDPATRNPSVASPGEKSDLDGRAEVGIGPR